MKVPGIAVASLALALLGSSSAFPAASIPAAEIQPLSSAVVSRTAPATVSAQFGDLLRRHAAAGLPVGTVQGLLNQVLKESIQQANRDTAALLEKLQRLNKVAESLRAEMSDLSAKSQALAQVVGTTDTALTVAHGDRLVAAADQLSVAAERLADKARSLSDLAAADQLELQQALTRHQQLAKYLSQLTRALNETSKSILSNLKG